MNILTLQEVKQKAPSIFAREKSPTSTSDRYSFLSTEEVLDGLIEEGWKVLKARQTRSKSPYVKHSLSLVHSDEYTFFRGNEVPCIDMVNSHDGGCSYQLRAGIEVVICENGLKVPEVVAGIFRIRHTNRTIEDVLSAAHTLRNKTDVIFERMARFKERELTQAEQFSLASKARDIRFGEDSEAIFPASSLLTPRRYQDAGNDLWSTFNRVQENLIRGGFAVDRVSAGGRLYTRRAKSIRSIDEDTRINTELWQAAEELLALPN